MVAPVFASRGGFDTWITFWRSWPVNNGGQLPWDAFVVSFVTLVIVLIRWWLAEREAKRERIGRLKAEAELMDITRRGRAPLLRAIQLRLPFRQFENEKGSTEVRPQQDLQPGKEVERVGVPKGTLIAVNMANDGEAVRNATDNWEEPYGLQYYPDGLHKGNFNATELRYLYDPSKHGQTLRITISFETMDGLKLHQTYETRHGFCEFRRVDPA